MSIFLGGTGSSNELHDYEEGTWTPTINNGTFSGFLQPVYTKVGDMCYLHGGLLFTNNTTSSSGVQLSNLPFTGASSQYTGTVWLRRTSTGDKPYVCLIGQIGNTTLSVHHNSNGNDMGGDLIYSNFQHNATYFQFSIVYKVTT